MSERISCNCRAAGDPAIYMHDVDCPGRQDTLAEPDQATTLPGPVMVALVAVYHFQRTRGLYLLTAEALQYVPPDQRVTPIPTGDPEPEPLQTSESAAWVAKMAELDMR